MTERIHYEKLTKLAEKAVAGGGFMVASGDNGVVLTVIDLDGELLDIDGDNAINFLIDVKNVMAKKITDAWETLENLGVPMKDAGFDLVKGISSLNRSADPGEVRSQAAIDNMLDTVAMASGNLEQAASNMRSMADQFSEQSDELDSVFAKYGDRGC